ncbi:IS66 family transposase [Marinicrinis sediminis]|uniref:Transposase n=1 Tax=Marinicrinis sediminis TaxID=1652465 RepID=A0ABW5R9F7_9BACL
MPSEERLRIRTEESRPVVDDFFARIRKQRPKVLPEKLLGKAMIYCLNQQEKPEAFLQDGRLELDNNRCERSIKPFVIEKKFSLQQYTTECPRQRNDQ